MNNDRPIEDPRLQQAMNQVRRVLERFDFAGAFMIVAPKEAAFGYKMDAEWSAARRDPETPMGFRITASLERDGLEGRHSKLEGVMHTVCQLSDFGEQTTAWMEDLKLGLRRSGLDFDHTPFNGKPLGHVTLGKGTTAPPEPPAREE